METPVTLGPMTQWRTQDSETLNDDATNVLPLDNCDQI
jgi:hypothetical protein